MLCRNRVADYDSWKSAFDADADRGREAGLVLTNMWRSLDDPNNVFFTLAVEDLVRAEAFLNSPESIKTGESSGVIDGEYTFAEAVTG